MRPFFLACICFLTFCNSDCLGYKIFPYQKLDMFIVDDFEDANLHRYPKWWRFGVVEADIVKNTQQDKYAYLEGYSLRLSGNPNNWFVGGIGTYFSIDAAPYNSLKLIVKGNGLKSGVLVVELFDDDNENYEIEIHPDYPSQTKNDDRFVYTLRVNWDGWRVVMIPLAHFVDANPGIGDDKWNPYKSNGSGGLLQMQFILMASDKDVYPDIWIDNVKFFQKQQLKSKIKPSENDFDDWF